MGSDYGQLLRPPYVRDDFHLNVAVFDRLSCLAGVGWLFVGRVTKFSPVDVHHS
jgi:hypothetical protein